MDQGRKMLFLVTKTDKMDTLKGPDLGEDIGNINLVDKSNSAKKKFVFPTQSSIAGNRIFPKISLLLLPRQLLYGGVQGDSEPLK